jgi:hypothetical protein
MMAPPSELAERNMGGVPRVLGNLLDLQVGGIGKDPPFDRAVVDNVARRCHEVSFRVQKS